MAPEPPPFAEPVNIPLGTPAQRIQAIKELRERVGAIPMARENSVSFDITVGKDELISILETNRTAHIALFEEAYEGWKTAFAEELQEHLEEVAATSASSPYRKERNSSRWGTYVSLKNSKPPTNQAEHYDTALQMLAMHTRDTVDLDTLNYTKFVNDDWDWKDEWMTSNSGYTSLGANR